MILICLFKPSQIVNLVFLMPLLCHVFITFSACNFFVRLHVLVSARQADKQAMVQCEKRLAEERRLRSHAENQLASERKAKKAEDAATARAVAMAAAAAASAANK